MKLPPLLDQAIENESASLGTGVLTVGARDLSGRYRQPQGQSRPARLSAAERAAYLAVRAPATYAAAAAVLTEARRRMPDLTVRTLVDLGSGPGTAAWAAAEAFDELTEITLIERDQAWISLGRRLAAHSDRDALKSARWREENIAHGLAVPASNIAIACYVVGELTVQLALQVVESMWASTTGLLVLIEPGTPAGYRRIIECRSALIAAGAHIIAPCPHSNQCPLPPDDWCHFAQRLERTSHHRRAKGGSLSYEDEKFSYVIASRTPSETAEARIIRRPRKLTGHVQLELCTVQGLKSLNVTRKDKASYAAARKSAWGDTWQSQ